MIVERLRTNGICALGISIGLLVSACAEPQLVEEATTSERKAEVSSTSSSLVQPTTTTSLQPLVTKTPNIEYADSGLLDVYAPTSSGPWPVVVAVHGISSNKGELAALSEAVATEGAVVFNISTAFSIPPLDGIEDIACAVRFARAKAPEYGGDPTSITLVGRSSGAAKGSIVAMDGNAYDSSGCVVTEESALPDAFVGYEGPYDYATHTYGSFNVAQVREDDVETWAAVDPYSHIGGNEGLIVRIIHGRDDDSEWYDVLPEVSTTFHDTLAAAGYDVELTYVDGANHGPLRPSSEAFAVTVQEVLDVISR